METLKGKVGALSRVFAEPVTSGIKDAMDSIGASWAGHGPEVERGLRKTGELLGQIVKAAAPIISVVGKGLATVAAGGDRLHGMLRNGILAWVAWKAAGSSAGAAVGQAVLSAGRTWQTGFNNALVLSGQKTRSVMGDIQALGACARSQAARMGAAFKGVGVSLASSLKGPALWELLRLFP